MITKQTSLWHTTQVLYRPSDLQFFSGCSGTWICKHLQVLHCEQANVSLCSWAECHRNLGFTQISTKSCFPAKLKFLGGCPYTWPCKHLQVLLLRKPTFLSVPEPNMRQKLRVYTNVYQIIFSCKAEILGWLLQYMNLQASASPTLQESHVFSLLLSWKWQRNLGCTQRSTKS